MFTQQCLIHKNTKEIINFLNEIGYTLYEGSDNFSKNVACSCKFNTYFTFDDDEYVFPNIMIKAVTAQPTTITLIYGLRNFFCMI